MLRFLLLSILLTFLYRAASRLLTGVARGLQDGGSSSTTRMRGARSNPGQHSVQMSRDPVCGTFVVPERAVALSGAGSDQYYFCSTGCRDQFVASQQATRVAAQGRTA